MNKASIIFSIIFSPAGRIIFFQKARIIFSIIFLTVASASFGQSDEGKNELWVSITSASGIYKRHYSEKAAWFVQLEGRGNWLLSRSNNTGVSESNNGFIGFGIEKRKQVKEKLSISIGPQISADLTKAKHYNDLGTFDASGYSFGLGAFAGAQYKISNVFHIGVQFVPRLSWNFNSNEYWNGTDKTETNSTTLSWQTDSPSLYAIFKF